MLPESYNQMKLFWMGV